jgi:c-di-GMP-binding flagellar brake protein YcgR
MLFSSDGETMTTERRHFIRPEALNLLDYLVVDAQGRQGEYSMGRTLNISKGGILMETHIPLPRGQQVMITLGLENNLVDIMGRIIYTTYAAGMHQNGIEFFHVAENDKKILNRYTKAFHKQFKENAKFDVKEL